MWKSLSVSLRHLLYSPKKIFYISLGLIVFTLLADGTFWNLWRLQQERGRLQASIEEAVQRSTILEVQISKAKDPNFLKRQARDRLDLLAEDEIVFVFPKGE